MRGFLSGVVLILLIAGLTFTSLGADTGIVVSGLASIGVGYSPVRAGVESSLVEGVDEVPIIVQPEYGIREEIVRLRTEVSKTTYLGDGYFQVNISSRIIHYKDDYSNLEEEWKEIDLKWNGKYLDTAPYILNVKDNEVSLTDKRTGNYIVVSYEMSGISIVPFNEGIKLQRVLQSAKDIRPTSFNIEIKGDSVQIYASAIDANNATIPVEFSIEDGVLTETITKLETADGKSVKFPIIIDPTLVLQPGAAGYDNYMAEQFPDSNYGTSVDIIAGNPYGDILRGLLGFDISSLPDEITITSATLGLYFYYYNVGHPTGRTYDVHRILRQDWSETTSTWNIYKSYFGDWYWTTAGAAGVGSDITNTDKASTTAPYWYPAWMNWDITNQVITAYDNDWLVMARVADSTETSGYDIKWYSSDYTGDSTKRPKLTIVYQTIPTVTTSACSGLAPTYMTGNGTITDTGGATVTRRGFCYSPGTQSGWISPTSHVDPDGKWNNEVNAYDDDTGTWSTSIYPGGYYLELYPSAPMGCNKVRFYAHSSAAYLSLDVYYESAWHNIFSGSFLVSQWVEKTIPAGKKTVSGARLKFTGGQDGDLIEFALNAPAPTTSDSVEYEDGSFGVGSYSLTIDDLEVETSYLVRAYAVNYKGTGYGSTVIGVTTEAWVPTVDTNACSNIAATSMQGNANITYYGGNTVVQRGFGYEEDLKYAWDGSDNAAILPDREVMLQGSTGQSDDFEWGSDADPLDDDGGGVDWTISAPGSSKAEIDTGVSKYGDHSARLYRDGSNNVWAHFVQTPLISSQSIEFWIRKSETAYIAIFHGNGAKLIRVNVEADEDITYYDGTTHDTGANLAVNTWKTMAIRDVNWSAGTYDIYLSGTLIQNDATMASTSGWYGVVGFRNEAGTSTVWLDDVTVCGEWTLEAWSYAENVGDGYWNTLFKGLNGDHQIILELNTGKLGTYDSGGGWFCGTGYDGYLLENSWHHIAVVGSGGTQTFYVDGVPAGAVVDTQSCTDIHTIGNNHLGIQPWGRVDEVRVWDDARTQSQIQANMTVELTGLESNLIGYWKFNEGTGVEFEDSTSNNNDGYIGKVIEEFNGIGDLSFFNMGTPTHVDTILAYTSTSSDPYYTKTTGISLDSDVYDFVVIRAKTEIGGGSTGQIFWWNEGGGPGPDRNQLFTITSDGAFHDYEIDLSEHAYWTGTCDGFRHDPCIVSGIDGEVGWIIICRDVDWEYQAFDLTDTVYEDGSFGEGVYNLTISSLTSDTWYRVRGYAVNSVGTGYGDVVAAQTLDEGDIVVSPISFDFGVVSESSTYWSSGSEPSWPLADGYFNITNYGSSCNVYINSTNFEGGVGWTLTSGSPGSDTVRMSSFKEGDSSGDGVFLNVTSQLFITSLNTSEDREWELKLETGTFTDGVVKVSTITFTAVVE